METLILITDDGEEMNLQMNQLHDLSESGYLKFKQLNGKMAWLRFDPDLIGAEWETDFWFRRFLFDSVRKKMQASYFLKKHKIFFNEIVDWNGQNKVNHQIVSVNPIFGLNHFFLICPNVGKPYADGFLTIPIRPLLEYLKHYT